MFALSGCVVIVVLLAQSGEWDLGQPVFSVGNFTWSSAGIVSQSSAGIVPALQAAEAEFRQGMERRGDVAQARTHFLKAAAMYELLYRRHPNVAALANQLALCYLLADRLPQAIVAYHRGLSQCPSDRTLRDGLRYARSLVVYPMGRDWAEPRWFQEPYLLGQYLPREGGLLLALLAWGGGWAAWLMERTTGRRVWRIGAIGAAAIAVGLLLIDGWEQKQMAEWSRKPLVVLDSDRSTFVRTGNGVDYPKRLETPVPRGSEARLRHRRGKWSQLEWPNGLVGWVPSDKILIVAPEEVRSVP